MSESVARLATYAASTLHDRDRAIDLAPLLHGTCLGGFAPRLVGRSVLVQTRRQIDSAAALVELDGGARRLAIAPPGLPDDHRAGILADADIDAVVTDTPEAFAGSGLLVTRVTLPIASDTTRLRRVHDTQWIMLTSGTVGRPKMVGHTLAALTAAIAPVPQRGGPTVWATFYDIRRYGGLQILLRAILGRADLVLSHEGEAVGDHLHRLGGAGVTALSGTPSHWRRVLMSEARGAINPAYVRLSGEIADQIVLDGLRDAYPQASIEHAYASTEAGVGFAVADGREGFPATWVEAPPADLGLKIVDGALCIRTSRAASAYLGRDAPPLTDDDGFVDTGDLVERRGDRCVFVGRRGGIINVGGLKVNPEEVEAAINAHVDVRMSLVKARRNPLTGAIVVADIVLREATIGSDALKDDIIASCRARLERHKVPAIIRFVPALELTPGGKLARTRQA